MLSIGGEFSYPENGESRAVRPTDQLPESPFQILAIGLSDNPRLVDDDLKRLAGLSALQEIYLINTAITDEGLKHLRKLPKLRALFLTGTRITNAGLSELRENPLLQTLALSSTQIDDEGLGHLLEFKALTNVELNNTAMTDAGLKTLAQSKQLTTITIGGTKITNSGLQEFVAMRQLGSLTLSGTRITDAGMDSVRQLSNLNFLSLNGTGITDDGLSKLREMKTMVSIDVRDTKVTADGVKQLAAALPQCRIYSDHGVIEPQSPLAAAQAAVATLLKKGFRVHSGNVGTGEVRELMSASDVKLDERLSLHSPEKSDLNPYSDPIVLEALRGIPASFTRGVISINAPLTGDQLGVLVEIPVVRSAGLLYLQNTGLKDLDFGHLSKLTHVTGLYLDGNADVSDVGLKQLAGISTLVDFQTGPCKITSAGLAALRNKPISILSFQNVVGIDDTAVEPLSAIPGLKHIYLKGTKITEAGVQKLASALPGCQIEWDGGVIEPTVTGWHGWPAEAPAPAIAPFDAEQAQQHQAAWAQYLNVSVEYTNSLGMKFRLIPPGEFLMGSTPEEIETALKVIRYPSWRENIESEGPQHKVVLTKPIYVGVTEVAQAQYERVMGINPSSFSATGGSKGAVADLDTGNHPVETVSWNDAVEFCSKLSQQEQRKPFYLRSGETVTPLEGTGYRLPTDAEWEYACRAGTATRTWTGDEDWELNQVAWSNSNGADRTHTVGELKANPFGLWDVYGNVFEWVQDGWDPKFSSQFQEKIAIDPSSPFPDSSHRPFRGGDWNTSPPEIRSSFRLALPASHRPYYVGIRVSLTVDAVRQALKLTGPALPKPVATTPAAPAGDAIDYAAERRTAEWAMGAKARFEIQAEGQIIPITEVSQLPSGPFHIKALAFTPQSTFPPSDYVQIGRLRGLVWLAFEEPLTDGTCLVEVGKVKSLKNLQLIGAQITDAHLSALTGLTNLTELDIMFTPIGDAGMGAVSQLTSLKKLQLGESRVGDEGLAQLKTLAQLESLSLGATVTDQGLGQLAYLPKLATVGGLKSHHLTEVGIGHLRQLPNVTYMNVVAATDEDLIRLKPVVHLTALSLNYHQFSASGLEALSEFPKLDYVDLSAHPNFDDSYWPALVKLSTLRKLILQDVKVTAEGIAKFREQRPEVLLNVNGQEYPAQP